MAPGTQIPDGWREMRLGDLVEVNRLHWNPNEGSSILYLDLTAIDAPGRLSPPKEVEAKDAPSRARRRVRSGDILISTVRPYLKGFARVSHAPHNLVASTGFAVLSPRPEVSGSVLYHHVMTPSFVRHLEAHMTGQAYPAVRPDDIADYQLGLPPLPEQLAISAVLDSIDEAISCTEAVIADTERLRESLLHELLTRGVPGWHTEWKEVRGVGTIPADWEVVRLQDMAESVTSGSRAWSKYFCSDGALFVRSQNVSDGTIDRSDAIYVQPPDDTEALRTRINEGDLLISITGEPGKVTVADETVGEAYVSQHVALLRLRNREFSNFAGWFLQGRSGQEQFRRMAYGQTRLGMNLRNVRETLAALPSLSERDTIVTLMNSVAEGQRRVREELDRLHALKASCADALLTGHVRAPA